MKILFVAAEVAPFAKVGGLADVAGSLPKALHARGHDVRIAMPLYRMIEDDPRWSLSTLVEPFDVPMNPQWTQKARVAETDLDGVPVVLIGTDRWFTKAVDSESIYQPGGLQHLFFSMALLELLPLWDWEPDIIHGNDWHAGFLPVLLREKFAERAHRAATVFTIHNFAYQGEFGLDMLDEVGLSHDIFTSDKVEAWGHVNFLKAGCAYSEQVNTVSETYAREIQTPEFGCMLDGLMRHLAQQGRLTGIINGIDTTVFDPETDPAIAAPYSLRDLSGKAICRSALLDELGLEDVAGAPLLGAVTRISEQKGLDLLVAAADDMIALPSTIVIQGLGDPSIAEGLEALMAKHPTRFCYIPEFDAALAQRIYSGCDGFLMPSAFEPCGLGQLIAMRYGTVPIVRKTGGLADTVLDGHNGFVFAEADSAALLEATARAVALFGDAAGWAERCRAGMSADYSWHLSAARYEDLYRRALSQLTSPSLSAAGA